MKSRNAGEKVRLQGATASIDFIIKLYRPAVEKATGCTLEVLGNNAGRGLIGLYHGYCDIALTAADMKTTLEAARMAGKALKAKGFVWNFLKDDEVVFAVNPKNRVNKLTDRQIKDIYTGKVLNWDKVGGPDLPIVLFSHNMASAARALIKSKVMKNEDYSTQTQDFTNQNLIAAEIAKTPGGFSALSKMNTSPKIKILKTEKIIRPLAFITKGEPAGKIKEVIAAFKARIAKEEK